MEERKKKRERDSEQEQEGRQGRSLNFGDHLILQSHSNILDNQTDTYLPPGNEACFSPEARCT